MASHLSLSPFRAQFLTSLTRSSRVPSSKEVRQIDEDRLRACTEGSFDQVVLVEAGPDERAGGTGILREADADVRQEQPGLDPSDCVFDQVEDSCRCSSEMVARRSACALGLSLLGQGIRHGGGR